MHGVPKKIMFRSRESVQLNVLTEVARELGTRLNFSTAYYPQTDGQTKRVNQILEDMLRACALDFLAELGIKICHMTGFLTTSIKPVYRWHRLKHYMDENAARPCFGMKQENASCLGQKC